MAGPQGTSRARAISDSNLETGMAREASGINVTASVYRRQPQRWELARIGHVPTAARCDLSTDGASCLSIRRTNRGPGPVE